MEVPCLGQPGWETEVCCCPLAVVCRVPEEKFLASRTASCESPEVACTLAMHHLYAGSHGSDGDWDVNELGLEAASARSADDDAQNMDEVVL